MKQCKVCGERKPFDAFYRAAGMKDGHRNECKLCFKQLAKARYDSATAVQRMKEWRERNPERHKAYQAEYRRRPDRKRAMRDLYYRRTFGISADEFDAMLEAQGGVCAICRQRPEREASLHVDHCHRTGRIRGILCVNCNQGIGKLGEDPELFRRAAEYLSGSR